MVEGATENATVVTDLLVGLRERGLDVTRPALVVIDGAKALASAVRAVFDRPVVQRCQLHKVRNVESKLPKALAALVAKKMRAAYRDPTPSPPRPLSSSSPVTSSGPTPAPRPACARVWSRPSPSAASVCRRPWPARCGRTCWVGDGTPCSVSAVGFPVPARRTRRAGCPRTGLSTCRDGSADEFGDLPDERHVVVAGLAEACSGRVDHVDVERRG